MVAFNVDFEVIEAANPEALGAAIVTYLETKDSTTNAINFTVPYQNGSRIGVVIIHAG